MPAGMRETVSAMPLPYGRITYIRFQGSGASPLSRNGTPSERSWRNGVIIAMKKNFVKAFSLLTQLLFCDILFMVS